MRYLKSLRIGHGWTLDFVAKKVGVTKSAYGNIEHGRRGASDNVQFALEDLFGKPWRVLKVIVDGEVQK